MLILLYHRLNRLSIEPGEKIQTVHKSKTSQIVFQTIFHCCVRRGEGDFHHSFPVQITVGISDFLDELIPVKYYLEVSSPGLERKFKSEKEFVIFNGRRISLKLKTPLEGEQEKIFKGEILDYSENEGLKFFRFDDGKELQIPKSNIQSAKLYID